MEDIVKSKDDNLINGNSEVKELTDELNRARDMFLEYEHRIKNLTIEKDEELRKVKIEKKKTEEDYRTAVKEKQLLKETERILLNTFDTLKQYYVAKESDTAQKTRTKNTNNRGASERNKDKTYFTCIECTYETNKKDNLMKHIVNDHETKGHRKPAKEQHHRRSRHGETSGNKEQQNNKQQYTTEERRNNGCCVHWNNGQCGFNDSCRYLHVESPYCFFQDNCSRKHSYRYFHAGHYFLPPRSSPWRTR